MRDRLERQGPKPKTRMVHLGPGAFFRAFCAVYTQEATDATGDAWGILAVSLRSTTVRDQLAPQDGVYTAAELAPDGVSPKVITVVTDVLVAPEDPGAVVEAMAQSDIRIVSLTVTEKGYCNDPATGRLDQTHPDILHDLKERTAPRSAPGLIVAALAARRDRGLAPITVLPCDNLPSNGQVVRGVILEFANALDPTLAAWIEAHVRFPSTMVDRITPATTPEDITRLERLTGYHDPGLVVHEPFAQWVIEDDFAAGRPAWERAGAQMVHSVEAHEVMKLRCLNGTHSALAYLGYLAGFETIADTVAQPAFAALCERLWAEEILPTVPQPEGEDLNAYCVSLLQRYRNPSIRHQTWQIAMDGSQKLPQRLLGTLRDNLEAGRLPSGLCLAVAAWMRYVGGVDETGKRIDVRDPLAELLKTRSDSAETPQGKVAALLAVPEVFGHDLPHNKEVQDGVAEAYAQLCTLGAQKTVEAFVT